MKMHIIYMVSGKTKDIERTVITLSMGTTPVAIGCL